MILKKESVSKIKPNSEEHHISKTQNRKDSNF